MKRSSLPKARVACCQIEGLEPRWLFATTTALGTIQEIQLPTGSSPQKMVVGKDGSVYNYDVGTAKMDRLRPKQTAATGVTIPVSTNQHFGMTMSKSGTSANSLR